MVCRVKHSDNGLTYMPVQCTGVIFLSFLSTINKLSIVEGNNSSRMPIRVMIDLTYMLKVSAMDGSGSFVLDLKLWFLRLSVHATPTTTINFHRLGTFCTTTPKFNSQNYCTIICTTHSDVFCCAITAMLLTYFMVWSRFWKIVKLLLLRFGYILRVCQSRIKIINTS